MHIIRTKEKKNFRREPKKQEIRKPKSSACVPRKRGLCLIVQTNVGECAVFITTCIPCTKVRLYRSTKEKSRTYTTCIRDDRMGYAHHPRALIRISKLKTSESEPEKQGTQKPKNLGNRAAEAWAVFDNATKRGRMRCVDNYMNSVYQSTIL